MRTSPFSASVPHVRSSASRVVVSPCTPILVETFAGLPAMSPLIATGYGQRRSRSASSGPRFPVTATATSSIFPLNSASIGASLLRLRIARRSIVTLVVLPVAPSRVRQRAVANHDIADGDHTCGGRLRRRRSRSPAPQTARRIPSSRVPARPFPARSSARPARPRRPRSASAATAAARPAPRLASPAPSAANAPHGALESVTSLAISFGSSDSLRSIGPPKTRSRPVSALTRACTGPTSVFGSTVAMAMATAISTSAVRPPAIARIKSAVRRMLRF